MPCPIGQKSLRHFSLLTKRTYRYLIYVYRMFAYINLVNHFFYNIYKYHYHLLSNPMTFFFMYIFKLVSPAPYFKEAFSKDEKTKLKLPSHLHQKIIIIIIKSSHLFVFIILFLVTFMAEFIELSIMKL